MALLFYDDYTIMLLWFVKLIFDKSNNKKTVSVLPLYSLHDQKACGRGLKVYCTVYNGSFYNLSVSIAYPLTSHLFHQVCGINDIKVE